MRILSLLVLMILFITGPLSATAEAPICDSYKRGKQPMQASKHEYQGKQILLLAGEFLETSGRDVGSHISNSNSYHEVWMCSNGGSVKGGMDVGYALSNAKATVRTPTDYHCVSACTIAAMGGYARIIDNGGHFVIHASSRVMTFGYEETEAANGVTGKKYGILTFIECDRPANMQLCTKIRSYFQKVGFSNFACPDQSQLKKLDTQCAYFDTKGKNYDRDIIALNTLSTLQLSYNADLIASIVSHEMNLHTESELDALAYYQAMLLDNQTSGIATTSYDRIIANFSPYNIYDRSSPKMHARLMSADMQALEQAQGLDQIFAIWQAILTDAELSLKEQVSRHIRSNSIDLGDAGEEALNIYDAKRTCQIQSSCELERHTAEALGFHNMYDYE